MRKAADDPGVYAPFSLAEALAAPGNPEQLDTCLVWPAPPPGVTPGFPVPPGASFPRVPALVLAGELDTVTSPKEAAQTTALFPEAWFVVVRNAGHETAVGDGGVFVTPYGGDLAQCAGPIVLAFIASGGNPGDTSCTLATRPIRTVPDFAGSWQDLAPAAAVFGNAAGPEGLALAAGAVETVGDAVARYYVTESGAARGLRGGRFGLTQTPDGYVFHLDRLRWTQDMAVSGTITWNQLDGHIQAEVTLAAPGIAGRCRSGGTTVRRMRGRISWGLWTGWRLRRSGGAVRKASSPFLKKRTKKLLLMSPAARLRLVLRGGGLRKQGGR